MNSPLLQQQYPTSMFFKSIENAILEVHGVVQAPMPMTALSFLSTMSAVVQRVADVRLPMGQVRPASVFTLIRYIVGMGGGTGGHRRANSRTQAIRHRRETLPSSPAGLVAQMARSDRGVDAGTSGYSTDHDPDTGISTASARRLTPTMESRPETPVDMRLSHQSRYARGVSIRTGAHNSGGKSLVLPVMMASAWEASAVARYIPSLRSGSTGLVSSRSTWRATLFSRLITDKAVD